MKKSITYLAFLIGFLIGSFAMSAWDQASLNLTISNGFVVTHGDIYAAIPLASAAKGQSQ